MTFDQRLNKILAHSMYYCTLYIYITHHIRTVVSFYFKIENHCSRFIAVTLVRCICVSISSNSIQNYYTIHIMIFSHVGFTYHNLYHITFNKLLIYFYTFKIVSLTLTLLDYKQITHTLMFEFVFYIYQKQNSFNNFFSADH